MEPQQEESFREFIDANPKLKRIMATVALGSTVEVASIVLDNTLGVAAGLTIVGVGVVGVLRNSPPTWNDRKQG